MAVILILIFSLFIRFSYALEKKYYHSDEWATIWFPNQVINRWLPSSFTGMNEPLIYDEKYTGLEIKNKYMGFNDPSVKNFFDDIKSLYKDTKDPHISNLYYTLFRSFFIGREVYDIKNIMITGTILNSIFYILSFFFLIKLLKLLFFDDNLIIIFSLISISLIPSSISFAIFLRPYQMQESFFIILTYLVFNTIKLKKYSIKNFLTITIITGLGYLALSSSIFFVLSISFIIFIYYIFNNFSEFKSIKNNNEKIKLIFLNVYKDKSLIYFASSFCLAFIVSFLLYNDFFNKAYSVWKKERLFGNLII